MPEQVHKNKQTEKRAEHEQDEAPKHIESTVDEEAYEDFLDEIDSVLEENAQEFVQNYIQRGGQ
jgi:ubiquitin-like protein Pup